MSNEIVKAGDLANLDVVKYSDDAFASTRQGGGDFLPRLQLMTANSAKCKAGEFPTNHYALVASQDYNDLGKNVDVLLVTWRPKALEIGENIVSSFDPSSETFQEIQRKAQQPNSGCMYGPEFLVYVPNHGFATFFMGSKSARRESASVKALLKQPVTLSSRLIKTKSYSWFAASCSSCSTPLSEMPSRDELLEQVEAFNNPKESDTEIVSDENTETRAR